MFKINAAQRLKAAQESDTMAYVHRIYRNQRMRPMKGKEGWFFVDVPPAIIEKMKAYAESAHFKKKGDSYVRDDEIIQFTKANNPDNVRLEIKTHGVSIGNKFMRGPGSATTN